MSGYPGLVSVLLLTTPHPVTPKKDKTELCSIKCFDCVTIDTLRRVNSLLVHHRQVQLWFISYNCDQIPLLSFNPLKSVHTSVSSDAQLAFVNRRHNFLRIFVFNFFNYSSHERIIYLLVLKVYQSSTALKVAAIKSSSFYQNITTLPMSRVKNLRWRTTTPTATGIRLGMHDPCLMLSGLSEVASNHCYFPPVYCSELYSSLSSSSGIKRDFQR